VPQRSDTTRRDSRAYGTRKQNTVIKSLADPPVASLKVTAFRHEGDLQLQTAASGVLSSTGSSSHQFSERTTRAVGVRRHVRSLNRRYPRSSFRNRIGGRHSSSLLVIRGSRRHDTPDYDTQLELYDLLDAALQRARARARESATVSPAQSDVVVRWSRRSSRDEHKGRE
jgi:hypothetical protein